MVHIGRGRMNWIKSHLTATADNLRLDTPRGTVTFKPEDVIEITWQLAYPFGTRWFEIRHILTNDLDAPVLVQTGAVLPEVDIADEIKRVGFIARAAVPES